MIAEDLILSVAGMTKQIENGIVFYKWNVFAPWESRFKAVITTRSGGSSSSPFSSLNMGHLVGDNPSAIAENRKAVSRVHGTRMIALTTAVIHFR